MDDVITKNLQLSKENNRLKAALYGIKTDQVRTKGGLRRRARKALSCLEHKNTELTAENEQYKKQLLDLAKLVVENKDCIHSGTYRSDCALCVARQIIAALSPDVPESEEK